MTKDCDCCFCTAERERTLHYAVVARVLTRPPTKTERFLYRATLSAGLFITAIFIGFAASAITVDIVVNGLR